MLLRWEPDSQVTICKVPVDMLLTPTFIYGHLRAYFERYDESQDDESSDQAPRVVLTRITAHPATPREFGGPTLRIYLASSEACLSSYGSPLPISRISRV